MHRHSARPIERISRVLTLQQFAKILVLAAFSLLAACASSGPVGGAPGVQVASISDMPAPTLADFARPSEDALIRPLDVIQVEVFGVEELSRQTQVSANGTISYPLIGSLDASGRTPDELALEIEDRLRNTYILNPDVTLRVTERATRHLTVGGEVSEPGRYPIEGPITLMEAVAIGGGLDEYASRDEVLVFRTVGDERYIGVYNLQGIARGNYPDPTVYPNDIVMVGDSTGRRRLEQVLTIATAISSPLVILERVLTR